MSGLWKKARLLLSVVLACVTGAIPACGSMGGGMKYFIEPATQTIVNAS
jgi:hypothetical protein